MNESLSEMQDFEVDPVKKVEIDFTKPHSEISKQILRLPFAEQQHWIDLWLEQPDIKSALEKREKQRILSQMKHPEPINKERQDRHWQD